MTRSLLLRGLLAGLIGGLFAATFALLFAEPRMDAAIAFEAHRALQTGMADEELVSRGVQRTWGLYVAVALYGTALGGLFAILFAALYGRAARLGPRTLGLLLALAAFIVVAFVPALKYPPNPPAVGLHETVRLRTGAYFAMLALSGGAAAVALWGHRRLAGHHATLDRLLLAGGIYVAVVAVGALELPVVDEVLASFPATLLWQFRLASLGTQAVFWLVTADLFGRMAERLFLARSPGFRP